MPLNQRDIALLKDILTQLGAGLSTSDSASVAELEGIAAQLAGTLTTRAQAPTSVTDTINALNDEVVLAVPQGATAVSIFSTQIVALNATLTAGFSFDGGATYINGAFIRADATVSPSATVSTVAIPYVAAVPPGLTHVRVRCTAYTSGSVSTVITASVGNMLPPFQQVTLSAGSNRFGSVYASGIWYNHSVTPLAGGATFTSASIDATAAATGNSFASTGTFAKEVNIGVFSDVAGSAGNALQIEISTDGTTWRLYDQVGTTAVGAGFVARLTYKPITRYWRVKYVNGAGAQGAFLLNSIAMAA